MNIDFNSLTEDHKQAAAEIRRVCLNLGYIEIADNITVKFGLKEIPVYDTADNEFLQSLERSDIKYSIQGYNRDNDIDYPIVTLSEDIRKFEKYYNAISSTDK